MTRVFLTYVLPLLLPAALYFAWLWSARRRAAAGGEGPARGPWWEEAPWFWLLLAGVVLVGITLGAVALTGGAPPGADYQAPRMEDGEIVPGRFRNETETLR